MNRISAFRFRFAQFSLICSFWLFGANEAATVAQSNLFEQLQSYRKTQEHLPVELLLELQVAPNSHLASGLKHPDRGIRILVAWETTRRLLEDNAVGDVDKKSSLSWFLGYIEGLLGVEAPPTWRNGVLNGAFTEGRFLPLFDDIWELDPGLIWDDDTNSLISTNLKALEAQAIRKQLHSTDTRTAILIYSDSCELFSAPFDCQGRLGTQLQMRHVGTSGDNTEWSTAILSSGGNISTGAAMKLERSTVQQIMSGCANQEIIAIFGLSEAECWLEWFSRKEGVRLGYFSSAKWNRHPTGVFSK